MTSLQRVISMGIPEASAIRAARYNAACAIGAGDRVGMIAPGRIADFIICRSDYTAKRVFLGGLEV